RHRREARAAAGVPRDARLSGLPAADACRGRNARDEGRGNQESAHLQTRRLPPGHRQVMATNGNEPRLKELYERDLRPRLKDDLGLRSVMQVPRVQKITLNMGVGEAKTDTKTLESALDELTTIA